MIYHYIQCSTWSIYIYISIGAWRVPCGLEHHRPDHAHSATASRWIRLLHVGVGRDLGDGRRGRPDCHDGDCCGAGRRAAAAAAAAGSAAGCSRVQQPCTRSEEQLQLLDRSLNVFTHMYPHTHVLTHVRTSDIYTCIHTCSNERLTHMHQHII